MGDQLHVEVANKFDPSISSLPAYLTQLAGLDQQREPPHQPQCKAATKYKGSCETLACLFCQLLLKRDLGVPFPPTTPLTPIETSHMSALLIILRLSDGDRKHCRSERSCHPISSARRHSRILCDLDRHETSTSARLTYYNSRIRPSLVCLSKIGIRETSDAQTCSQDLAASSTFMNKLYHECLRKEPHEPALAK